MARYAQPSYRNPVSGLLFEGGCGKRKQVHISFFVEVALCLHVHDRPCVWWYDFLVGNIVSWTLIDERFSDGLVMTTTVILTH